MYYAVTPGVGQAASILIRWHVQIDVVLGFHNGGDETLNVTNVMGSINSPASFNIFVQNFSAAVRICQ